MSQESEMAERLYGRLCVSPVSTAQLVRELRSIWGPEHGIGSVHGFIREVFTCLLRRNDIEVGHIEGSKFNPWPLSPEDIEEKIDNELMAMESFLDDDSRYVIRKKNRQSY